MRVLLAGDRPQDRDVGRKAALRSGLDCGASDCVALTDLRLRLAKEPAVHLVVVFMDPDPTAAAQAIKSVSTQTRQPIYAVTSNGAETARETAEAAGASGVWPLDRVREEMLNSSEELRRDEPAGTRRGRILAVTAAHPGVGSTTVATGLAFALAGKVPVVLAELGGGVPTLALNLDLTPPHSLAELIRSSDRMDHSMIRDTAVQVTGGVDVLAHLPETPIAPPLSSPVARDFHILLRRVYDWTVLDAGHPHGSEVEPIVAHSDAVIVITRLDPPSLRLTRQHVRTLTEAGIPADNIAVVVNRYGEAGQLAWRTAEESLRLKVRAWLPDDPKAVNRALTRGKPLSQVASGSKLNRELRTLATALTQRFSTATAR